MTSRYVLACSIPSFSVIVLPPVRIPMRHSLLNFSIIWVTALSPSASYMASHRIISRVLYRKWGLICMSSASRRALAQLMEIFCRLISDRYTWSISWSVLSAISLNRSPSMVISS